MANVQTPATPAFPAGIYRVETTDPWVGGENGTANIQAKQLAERTEYLKVRADEVDEAKEGAATLMERINAAGSSPRALYRRAFIPDAPIAASTGNVDIVAGGLLEIDGVQTAAGDLVFLKDQTAPAENGFWEAQTGAWNRYAGYADGDTQCFTSRFIDINSGVDNSGKIFAIDADAYVVGQSALLFRETYLLSVREPGKALFRDRRGAVEELESMSPAGYALVDESKARNLLDALGIRAAPSDGPATGAELAEAMAILRTRCNGTGTPDFSGLRYADYLDLPSLNDGATTYSWNGAYKNLRVMIAGFNLYKHAGDTENARNHIVFAFRNCVLTRRMNFTDTNTGGYAASEMASYLEGDFKTGLQGVLGDYLYTIRRLLSTKGNWAWKSDTVFLPSEREVWGTSVWDEKDYGGGLQAQYPLYRDSVIYKVKRHNGSRMWWWEASPYSGSAASFCNANSYGNASNNTASSVGGCAPAFCVA
ncbi:MAG: DUF6273 domain-containing protein [Spirochaetaceae bacterium]|nr:DUF6273 domain-containing protein [Spirochaetaceae bacterium]